MRMARQWAGERRGMRLLALVLTGLWGAVSIAVLVAYHPEGPFDILVRAAIFSPLPMAVAAIVWPPAGDSWRTTAAIAWLGLIAGLLLVPLLVGVLETLAGQGRQALFPSPEVAYAGLLALGMTCLFAAIGVVGARELPGTFSRTQLAQAASLATALTVLAAATVGAPSLANELALRDRPTITSRFGPTDTTLPVPQCDKAPALGGSAVLGGLATASVDGEEEAEARLAGSRDGVENEDWTASRTGDLGPATVAYHRSGDVATVEDARGERSLTPVSLGLADPRGLTVDGPIAALASAAGTQGVAEDLGIELVEEARSRHCRVALDGPSALAASALLRLLVYGSIDRHLGLTAWRGSLDWWVFADGQIGQAVITLGGYPGDAWEGGGLQAAVIATVTATNRAGPPILPSLAPGTPL
jgi:hypothetical protein